jgi:hypothetical protein
MKIKLILLMIAFALSANAGSLPVDMQNKIADAIKMVENSQKYPYGIKSVHIKGETQTERELYARRICLNTINNNYSRWGKNNSNKNFLDYLGDVYCPSSCDKIGNINWKNNIKKIVGYVQ